MPRSIQQKIQTKEREAECLRLRVEGASFEEIAAQVGFKGPSGAYKAYRRALDGIGRETIDEAYRLQSARLNDMLNVVWPDVLASDLRSIDAALKIMDRIDRLHGFDRSDPPRAARPPAQPAGAVLVVRSRADPPP